MTPRARLGRHPWSPPSFYVAPNTFSAIRVALRVGGEMGGGWGGDEGWWVNQTGGRSVSASSARREMMGNIVVTFISC